MKKRSILLTLVVIMLFMLTGCGKKTVITDENFKSFFEGKGYTIYDVTSQFSANEIVKSASLAESDKGYQIEFYVLSNEAEATGMFNTNKANFETYKGNSSSESSGSASNYSTYTLTTSGYYMHLCRVDNTLLYLKISEEYKDVVKKQIKELGY